LFTYALFVPLPMPKNLLPKEEINTLFEYRDGELYWRKRRNGVLNISKPAGTINATGRRCVKANNKTYLIHRLIWALHHDHIQSNAEVDHIDNNPLNNNTNNLRLATRSKNQRNRLKQKTNTSGFKGVNFRRDSNRWRARIAVNDKRIQLGSFDTPEEAHEAYKKAALIYHGEFANFG
jgi:hypothetical protein